MENLQSSNDSNIEKETGSSRDEVFKQLKGIIAQLYDLKEGYLQAFEDEDPEAAAKGCISGIIEYIKDEMVNLNETYDAFIK